MTATGQTALITGASSGIGRELARLFGADGYDLVLVARRIEVLQTLAEDLAKQHGISAVPLAADLSKTDAPTQLYDRLASTGTTVDVVVNNAGFGLRGRHAELPLTRQLEMIEVNITALTALSRLFLPGMLSRNRGGLLNVGSTAAFQPGPLMAVYYATKAYVESFTEAIAEEVTGSALHISCLAPGPTTTEFAQVAQIDKSNLFRRPTMTPEDVAKAGFDGWKRGEVVIVPGFSNWMGMTMVRVVPRSMVRRMVKRLNSTPEENG
jgi:hypothetical protein